MRKVRFFRFISILICSFTLVSCSANVGSYQLKTEIVLTPYQTRTPFVTPFFTQLAPETPIPTSTPLVYQIVLNDTLSRIAKLYGISIERLLAANPDVAPESLKIGQTLIIPFKSQSGNPALSSTPVPLEIGSGSCQSTIGGTICLIPVKNPSSQMLENVILKVSLLGDDHKLLASQDAVLPLNVLPPGQVLPAAVFFSGFSGQFTVQTLLITAISLNSENQRYLRTVLQNILVSISWDALSADIQGKIWLTDNEKPATTIWLVGVAYDKNQRIIGYRRWEWNGLHQPGSALPFNFKVYSLGPSIERVEILVEARP